MNTPIQSERGFVLPLLLVTLALLSLSLWPIFQALDSSRLRLERASAQSQAELAAASASARVAYLLVTEPVDQRGLRVGGPRLDASGLVAPPPGGIRNAVGRKVEEVIFDGRPYRLPTDNLGSLEVRIQDEAGLLNMNGGDEPAMEQLLEGVGIRPGKARALAASLADFVDGDQLRRVDGAEAGNYRRAGLIGPRDAPLRNRSGALGALGWASGITRDQALAIFRLTAAAPASQRLNLNTASPLVLRAVLGLDERAVRRIVVERERRALQSLDDVAEVSGVAIAGGQTGVTGLPSRHLRLSILTQGRVGGRVFPYSVEMGLTFAPPESDLLLLFRPASIGRGATSSQDPKAAPFPHIPTRAASRNRYPGGKP